MKRILLLSTLLMVCAFAFSQTYTFGTYPNCQVPVGFDIGQGASVGPYDNPSLNGCGASDDDCGIITPGVGGNNPAHIATSQLETDPLLGTLTTVNFSIFVFDANLKCTTAKPFPCPTYVIGYVVDLAYNSNTAPTTFYGVSEKQLVNPNGVNQVTIPITTDPNGAPTRVYLDFSTDLTCSQPNTKYVIDLVLITSRIPLPVHFQSFSASRNQGSVDLSWVTASEQNNSGFFVQRNGTGGWESVVFVPTKASEGTSTSENRYQYTDINSSNGVSQYRIMQVDIGGKLGYSPIRSVQGLSQAGRLIISPNPSSNGIVNVTFPSANVKRDIQLSDVNGRMVKQWNNYSDNSLQIQELNPGLYQLRVMDKATGNLSVQKIMVTNR